MRQIGRLIVVAIAALACTVSVARSDAAPGDWTSVASLNAARYAEGVAAVGDQIVAIDGVGDSPSFTRFDDVEGLTVGGAAWTTLTSLDPARGNIRALTLANGLVYVIGGSGAGETSTSLAAFDPSTGQWHTKAALPVAGAMVDFEAAVGVDGLIYVFGGTTPAGSASLAVYAYDPVSDAWSTVSTTMPHERIGGSAVSGPDGLIYLLGGSDGSSTDTSVDAYNPVSNAWSTPAPLPERRLYAEAQTGADGNIYVFGGATNTTSPPVFATSTLVYSPTSDTWSAGPHALATPRLRFASAVGSDNRIYAVGGYDGTAVTASVEALEVAAAAPSAPASTQHPLLSATAREGNTISCSPGAWTGSPSSRSYSFLVDGVTVGSGQTYTPTHGDAGHTLKCEEDATNAIGTGHATSIGETVYAAPPQTTITAGPNAATNATIATFSLASSVPGSTFECQLDSTAWVTCTSSPTFSGLADGAHEFQARAIEPLTAVVDPSPASYSWSIDTSRPATTISGGPPATTEATNATFSLSSSKPNSSFECQLDGSAWQPCTAQPTYAGLGFGSHTFAARATDALGNLDAEPPAKSWTILSPPTVAFAYGPSSPTTLASATFGFLASDLSATFSCKLDDGPWYPCTSPQQFAGLAIGAHTFEVQATDALGGLGTASRSWQVINPTSVTIINNPVTVVVVILGTSATPSRVTATLRIAHSNSRVSAELTTTGSGVSQRRVLARTSKTHVPAGTQHLSLALNKTTRDLLQERRHIAAMLRISVTPPGGHKATTVSKRITLRQ